MVSYSVLFDHTFSDQNYLKVTKFLWYESSISYFNYILLVLQISTVQWLNCRNMKDELNCSYIGWGLAYVLKVLLSISTIEYLLLGASLLNCNNVKKDRKLAFLRSNLLWLYLLQVLKSGRGVYRERTHQHLWV